MDDAAAREKISNAILKMMYQFKYFSILAMKLKVSENDAIPSMATDGLSLYYNAEFVNKLSLKEVTFVILHEVIHCIYDHIGRAGGRNLGVWNMAVDYVTNGIIKDTVKNSNLLQMPEEGLYDAKFTHWTSEKVYDELIKDQKNKSKSYSGFDQHLEPSQGDGGGSNKDHKGETDGDGDGNGNTGKSKKPSFNKQELEENMNRFKREMVQTTKNLQATGYGDIPLEILRMVDELDKPRFSWRDILRKTVESAYVYDRSFSRPSRRSFSYPNQIYLPGQLKDSMINIAVAIDTSMSIGHDDIKLFLSEIQGIMSSFDSYKIHIWCFDADVKEKSYKVYTEIDNSDMRNYEPLGGGGTDFGKNWKFMEKEGIEVDRFIMLTDGYCDFDGCDEQQVDTLWVINDPHSDNRKFDPPFGEVVYFDN